MVWDGPTSNKCIAGVQSRPHIPKVRRERRVSVGDRGPVGGDADLHGRAAYDPAGEIPVSNPGLKIKFGNAVAGIAGAITVHRMALAILRE
jgi:hypothetical protein